MATNYTFRNRDIANAAPTNINAGGIQSNFGSMLDPGSRFNVAKGPQNAFNESELQGINARGLRQLGSQMRMQNQGAANSAAARGVAGPDFSRLYDQGQQASMRGALAEGDLTARLEGLNTGLNQFNSMSNATGMMGGLAANDADRMRQIWGQQTSTALAEDMAGLQGDQALEQIAGRGHEDRTTSTQEHGQELERMGDEYGYDVGKMLKDFQRQMGMAQFDFNAGQSDQMLQAFLQMSADPNTFIKIMEGEDDVRDKYKQVEDSLRMMYQGSVETGQGMQPLQQWNPETAQLDAVPNWGDSPMQFPISRIQTDNWADIMGFKGDYPTMHQAYSPGGVSEEGRDRWYESIAGANGGWSLLDMIGRNV